jgi:NADH dehydrogenase
MTGRITVFGGTGFIGRHLVTELLRSGATMRLAVRHPAVFRWRLNRPVHCYPGRCA